MNLFVQYCLILTNNAKICTTTTINWLNLYIYRELCAIIIIIVGKNERRFLKKYYQ